MNQAPVLSVQNLGVAYGNRRRSTTVLNDVSFDVFPGETVGLVGESGSGKTQTMLAVMRLLGRGGTVTHGRVLLNGTDLLSLSDEQMRRLRGTSLGMVFQDPMTSLDPVIRVGKQVVEAIRAHDTTSSKSQLRERAVELLTMVGIPSPTAQLRRYPHQLSGGMKQRVGVAIAMANEPDVVIADEPTTALDVTIQAQVLDVMRRLQQETSSSLILITHDLSLLAECADRVVVMYAGVVVEIGTINEIFYRPKHPYTAGLITSRPTLDSQGKATADLPTIPGQPAVVSEITSGCPFVDRCDMSNGRDECRTTEPELHLVEGAHLSRCHWPAEVDQLMKTKASSHV